MVRAMARDALREVRRRAVAVPRDPRRLAIGTFAATSIVAVSLGSASCVRPPQMCTADADCRTLSCVAGRCIGRGATPSIANAHRILYPAVDIAYLRRGDTADEDVAIATLGSNDSALLLLRFAVQLPPETAVLEAYLLLERATEVDDDPTPLALHAARIVEPWDSGSVSWGRQPRFEDSGAPVTRVHAGSGPLVRMDVRTIVQRWRRRAAAEFGLAVVADGRSETGISIALAPTFDSTRARARLDPPLADVDGSPPMPTEGSGSAGRSRWREPRSRGTALAGPQLELYVQ